MIVVACPKAWIVRAEKRICLQETGDRCPGSELVKSPVRFLGCQHRYLSAGTKAALALTFIGTKEKEFGF